MVEITPPDYGKSFVMSGFWRGAAKLSSSWSNVGCVWMSPALFVHVLNKSMLPESGETPPLLSTSGVFHSAWPRTASHFSPTPWPHTFWVAHSRQICRCARVGVPHSMRRQFEFCCPPHVRHILEPVLPETPKGQDKCILYKLYVLFPYVNPPV